MIEHIVSDFSRVLLLPAAEGYSGGLNSLYREKVLEGEDYFAVFKLNAELLDFYMTLKPRYTLSIFTSEIVQNDPAVQPFIRPIFANVFSAKELGLQKTQREAYLAISALLNARPETVLYIDDNPGNVAAATAAGFTAIQYLSNEQAIEAINNLL